VISRNNERERVSINGGEDEDAQEEHLVSKLEHRNKIWGGGDFGGVRGIAIKSPSRTERKQASRDSEQYYVHLSTRDKDILFINK